MSNKSKGKVIRMDKDNSHQSNKLPETLLISQKVIPYLQSLGYKYLDNEFPVKLGNRKYRADLIAFTDRGKTKPYIVVEVKKNIANEITLFDPLIQQAFSLAVALGDSARYILVTDGDTFFWFERSAESGSLIQISSPPEFVEEFKHSLLEKTLIPITDPEQFIRIMQSAIQVLKSGGVQSELRIGIEINRILIAKLYDEQLILTGERSRFQVSLGIPVLVIRKIEELYYEAVQNVNRISLNEVQWFSSPKALVEIVTIFEPYTLSSITPSIIGYFFWQALSNITGMTNSYYATPIPIAELLVHLAQPGEGEHIIDPACGTGLFLIETLKYVGMNSPTNLSHLSKISDQDFKLDIMGVERDAEVAELAKTNFILNGIPPIYLIKANALDKQKLVSMGIEMGGYDMVLLDPPTGLANEGVRILRQYEITHQGSRITREMLFVELAVDLAKPGGIIAILVPDSLLYLPSYLRFRSWLLNKTTPKAIVSLPVETFAPVGHSGKSTILLLRKGSSDIHVEDDVLVAEVQSVGYDKFGELTGENGIFDLMVASKNFLETGRVNKLEKNGRLKVWPVSKKDLNAKRLDVAILNPESINFLATLKRSRFPLIQLNNFVQIITGQNFKSYVDKGPGTALVLHASAVRDLTLDLSAGSYISAKDLISANRAQVKQGDILIATTGPYLGRAAVVSELPERAVVGGEVTILRPTDELDTLFLAVVINSEIGREQIARLAITTTQQYISRADLGSILIPNPSLQHQKMMAARLKDMLSRSQELFQEARQLELRAKRFVVAEILEEGENE